MARFSRDRLAKILGLLGSDADGEVLAAARQAVEMQRACGLTWDQLLAGQASQSAVAAQPELPPDVPVWWAGKRLIPPHGGRWLLSILHLLQPNPRTFMLRPGDAEWLRAMPARLAKRSGAIMPHEAANLILIWNEAHQRMKAAS